MKRTYTASELMVLAPGVMPEDGAVERAAERRKTDRLNKNIRHLQRRIAESDGRDKDAEFLLGELLYGNAEDWKA